MQSRPLVFGILFLVILCLVIYGAWYWMQTPQFKKGLEGSQLTAEEKLQTLESLRHSADAPPSVSEEEKVETLQQLRASNEAAASSDMNSSASHEAKLKTLESLHDAQ